MTENIPLYEYDIIIDSIICNFYDDDDIWEDFPDDDDDWEDDDSEE